MASRKRDILKMAQYLLLSQIIVAIFLIVLILLQQRGTALGSAFGGESGFYATKRGIQKKIFWLTVFFGAAFIILAFLNLIF
ncbi:MAG: preprotein translocase subunit SecG [Patescibacteria group bacterium]|nr:preprotein translocase subunit SecG [Patescibacteria group bacterium]